MDSLERQAQHVSVGGYRCPCCGPSPKERPQHRRTVRRRMSQALGGALAKDPDFTDCHGDLALIPDEDRIPLLLVQSDIPGRGDDIAAALTGNGNFFAVTVDDASAALKLIEETFFDLVILIDDIEDSLLREMTHAEPGTAVLSLFSCYSPSGRVFLHAGEAVYETGEDAASLHSLVKAALPRAGSETGSDSQG